MHTGYEYTENMDQMVRNYQKSNLLTMKEMSKKLKLSDTAIHRFRERKRISVGSLKKFLKYAGLDLQQS